MGARAEVLEVGTYGGKNGSMLAGVEVAHIQPALAHLVGLTGALEGRLIVASGPATASVCPWVLG